MPEVGFDNDGNHRCHTQRVLSNSTVDGNQSVGGTLTVHGVDIGASAEAGGTAPVTSYAAGTAYSLTATAAALTFGTTSPSGTLTAAGTWAIKAVVQVQYNAATFAASRAVTLKLRRTNNTAADLTNGSSATITGVTSTLTSLLGYVVVDVIYTTANANDAIALFGVVSVVPTAGSLDCVEAFIIARRIA